METGAEAAGAPLVRVARALARVGALALAASLASGVLAAASEAHAQQWLAQGLLWLPLLEARDRVLCDVRWAAATGALGLAALFAVALARERGAALRAAPFAVGASAGALLLAARHALDRTGVLAEDAVGRIALEATILAAAIVALPLVAPALLQRLGRPRPRGALVALALAAGVLGTLEGAARWRAAHGPGSRDGVLLVVVDTLRADRTSLHGGPRDTTPALRALAERAVVFEQASAPAPWTSPSVAALLTSRHPAEMGYGDSQKPVILGRAFATLTEILRDAGYRTHAIVAHTYVGRELGFAQGFQGFDEDEARGHLHVSSPAVTDKAIRWLRANRGTPFFLLVHYFDPHFAYVLHAGYDFDPRYTGRVASRTEYSDLLQLAAEMTEADREHLLALYDSELAFTDRELGRLLDALVDLDLEQSTLVAVAGDHGEAFLDRSDAWIGHGITLYDELVRVPLLIRHPRATAGSRVDAPVSLVDLAPTLLDGVGLAPPPAAEMAGRRLPLARPGESEAIDPAPVFAETHARGRWLQSVREGPLKLIADLRGGRRELFDLARDPGEREDLAAREGAALARLEARRAAWDERARARGATATAVRAELSDEQEERLRALGYLQ